MKLKINKSILNVILIANFFCASAVAEDAKKFPAENMLKKFVAPSKNLLDGDPGDIIKVLKFKQKDALSLRAEFYSEKLPKKTIIIVRNDDKKEQYIYGDKQGLWRSAIISGDGMTVEVHLPKDSDYSSASLILKRVFFIPQADNARSIIGGYDERTRLICHKAVNDKIYNHGLSSAHMHLGGWGSGAILGKDNLFLTNDHVVDNTDDVKNGEIWLNWQHTDCDGKVNTEKNPVKIQGEKLLLAGGRREKDYALLTADPFDFKYGNIKRLFGGLAVSKKNPLVGDTVYIPQYGNGGVRPAFVADNEHGIPCQLLSVDAVLRYNCDTQGGSSGSPVISKISNELVGLHYAGGSKNNVAVTAEVLMKDLSGFITDKNNQECLPLQHEISSKQVSITPFSYAGELAKAAEPIWFTSSDREINLAHHQGYSRATFIKKDLLSGEVTKDEKKSLKLWLENNCGEFRIDQKPVCSHPGITSLKYQMDIQEKDIVNTSWKKFWLVLTRNSERGIIQEDVTRFGENLYDIFTPPFSEDTALVKELALKANKAEKLSWECRDSDRLGLVAFYEAQGPVSMVGNLEGETHVPVLLRDEKTGILQTVVLDVTRETNCSRKQMNSAIACSSSNYFTRFNVHFDPEKNPSIAEGKFTGILPLKMKSWKNTIAERNVLYKISLDNQGKTPEWNSATIYEKPCQKVKYAGKIWSNGWWTQNQPPGSNGPCAVWRLEGSAEMHTHCKLPCALSVKQA